jgi:hypothetical protein
MAQPNKYLFFRNDDVRDSIDKELIDLTELCFKHKIPISHAVEPANVTLEVVDWLVKSKKEYPELLEIIQHGYDHNKNNPDTKMEFGGNRTYEDQLMDIKKGKEIMDNYFGSLWSPVFTFPYGTYNYETLKAVNQLNYSAISSKVNYSTRSRAKNTFGRVLGKDFLLNKKISYHSLQRKHFNFREISVSANLIRKYTGNNTADHYTKQEIIEQVNLSSRFSNIVGVLFHHRFHSDHMQMIEQLIVELKDKYTFSTIMKLVR